MLVNVQRNIFHIEDLERIFIGETIRKRGEPLYTVYLKILNCEPVELFYSDDYRSVSIHFNSLFLLLSSGVTTITLETIVKKSRLKS